LRQIADEGAAAFYGGTFAAALEQEMIAGGGALRADDLNAYQPRIFEEAPQSYRGYQVVTAGDQIACEALHILECFDLAALDPVGADFRHLMAEALGCAFADTLTYYSDPRFVPSPVDGLASHGFGHARAAGIRLDRAAPRPIAAADPWPFESTVPDPGTRPAGPTQARIKGTSQMAAVDRWGNMATLCTSLGLGFGSLVTVPGTGVLLHDVMYSFDARPGHPNSIAPGKLYGPGVPVLIAAKGDRPVFGTCGSGGTRIETGCLHTLIYMLDHGMQVQEAAALPRVHCQGNETVVDERIPGAVRAELAARGHEVVAQPQEIHNFGRVAAVHRGDDGTVRFGIDPAPMMGGARY
jgi:gamma-glutamyltranspeptidase/glutathione hydrolase